MKRHAITLLILGLIIESVGYMIDKADFFDFTLVVLSPTYVQGTEAIGALRSGDTLASGAPGFAALERLFKDEARKQNPAELVDPLTVRQFRPGNASLAFGVGGTEPRLPLFVSLSNGQEVKWETGRAEAALDALKERRLTLASLVVFVFGIALQVVGFVVERRESSPASPAPREGPADDEQPEAGVEEEVSELQEDRGLT